MMPHVELPQAEFKVVLLGDSDTGKTSLVLRFVEGYYREGRGATIGAFFLTKRLTLDKMTCKLLLWDTAGQEQFQKLAVTYYKQAAAAIVCFDVTRPNSLERLEQWLHQVQSNMSAHGFVLCVAACKTDLPAAPGIEQEAQLIAQQYGALYIPTSAKTDKGVSAVFSQVAERVLQCQEDAMAGKGKPIPVTMGCNMHHNSTSPRVSRLQRSLSPAGPRERKTTAVSAIHNNNHNNSMADEKKMDSDDDALVEDKKMAASPTTGIMCDSGLLVCGPVQDAYGFEKCCIL